MIPPSAKTVAHRMEAHGQARIDPYFWLRDRNDPEVIAHLEAENAHTDEVMAPTLPLQERLYQEMIDRIQETDLSVPVRIDDFAYYIRTEAGQQYPIYCRKRAMVDADEEILLDLNRLAEGEDYMALGVFEVSPDHQTLAFAIDTTGAETYTLRFKNLQSGELFNDEILGISTSLVWANDSRTVFYTMEDEAKRPYQIYRHRLGDGTDDTLIHHETDELFRCYLDKTKDHAFLVLMIASIETSEVRVLDADTPTDVLRVIEARRQGLRYRLEHRDGLFYILTNDDGAENYKLVTAPTTDPTRSNWREMIAHDAGIKLDAIEMFAEDMVVYTRRGGLTALQVVDFATGQSHDVHFEEPVYTVHGARNPNYRTRQFRFSYTSLTTPRSIIDYDLAKRTRTLLKQQPVLGDFDSEAYRSERLFATAADGAKVPISLVYRKGERPDGGSPCLLYGYGAYGASMDPTFSSHRISLLDRGMVFAIAHIRGGQELGRQWYEQGKFLNKKNSFTDFIACGEALVEAGITSHDKLALMGGSAGGLLIGAVINMAPDLARVAVAKVPFVDVLTTMLDETLPLTIPEYEEWGNPGDPAYYDYIASYSPYDNVEALVYPHLLVTAGLNDPRVHYWEPAKWVAKMRNFKRGHRHLLLKTHMEAGHGGASGRYDSLRELAFDYAFILRMLDVDRA